MEFWFGAADHETKTILRLALVREILTRSDLGLPPVLPSLDVSWRF